MSNPAVADSIWLYMALRRRVPHDAGMTSTATAPPAPPRRLVLVPVGPPAGRSDTSVRRYRLARLRLEGREVAREERFAHCKRAYD